MTEPTFRSSMTVELTDSMGTQESIVRAARVSTTGADSRGAAASAGLLKRLYADGHGTPFESCVLSFYFEVPIFISRQIVKHRLSSINETSGRYRELEGEFYTTGIHRPITQVGKTADYVFEHAPVTKHADAAGVLRDSSEYAWARYEYMLSQGVAKEVARMVLPVNTYTQMYMTANLRSWLNFIQLRVDWGEGATKRSHAQYEVEQVGKQVAHVIETLYPTVWESFVAAGYQAV